MCGCREKKKKEKKKKKKSSADEAPSAAVSAAATSSTAATASSSAVTSSASTPAFAASSPSLDQFDAFAANGAFGANVTPVAVITASGTAVPGAGLAQPGEADKPKKSRKSKKGGAEPSAAAPAPPGSSSAAAPPSVQVSGEYDLTTFASIPTPRGPASSDLDILTGTNAPVGRLEDMFSTASSERDQPLDQGEEEDGFVVEEEPALLDMIQGEQSQAQSANSAANLSGAAAMQKKTSDVWDLAADFTNIDNLVGAVPKKKTAMREEVSMSMMKSMQPFGGGGGGLSSASSSSSSYAPSASASSPFFSVPSAGGGFGGAPMGGMGMGMGGMGGMGGGSHGMAGPPAVGGGFGGMPGGYGAPMQGPPAGFHGPPAGGMGGAMGGGMGGGIGPFAGLGGFGGMGGPPQGSGGGGGGGGGLLGSDLPFAAPQGAGSRKLPANGKPLIFDAVPQARQQPMSQPTNAAGGPTGPKWNR